MIYYYKMINSPVGKLKLVSSDYGLAAILWENDHPKRVRLDLMRKEDQHPLLLEATDQLNDYFAGTRRKFTVLLHLEGTEFQKSVWNALYTIPFGQTRSYAQIANQIDNPKAVRAVGTANGKNPVSIIVPCHRVIGSNGTLTGFAGGLKTKAFLLEMESTNMQNQ